MFERYTELARRALFFARFEVSAIGGRAIETEHLLLGLLRDGDGLAARILEGSQVSLQALRQEIEAMTSGQPRFSTSVEIPFSSETRDILQSAGREADDLGHERIGTGHLLLGILSEPRSLAGTLLEQLGMDATKVRQEVIQLAGQDDRAS